MIEIAFANSFKRAYRRKIAGNRERENRFRQKLKLFTENPFEPQLRNHKLSGKLQDLWSFSVEYDLQTVFYFETENKVVFVDIGTHDEVY